MEHSLAEQGKARPAVAHPLDEFELVHFSLDHPVALLQGEASFHRCFVSLSPSCKTSQFWDLTGLCLSEPDIELLSRACSQHLCKPLNEIVSQVHFL
jgi:hypothetical protein